MDLQNVRCEFPVAENWIYLNHAAVAPLCRPAARAMRKLVRDVEENGTAHIENWLKLYDRARHSCAQLIGARPSEIALLKNTTEGLITVANGLNWRAGDNVVLARGEFPANVYPWLNLAGRGVEIHWVEEREGRLWPEDFAAAIDARTRVLSVSSVEFFSGFRNDLKALSTLCEKNEILFAVDAIQSLGALPIDVEDLHIDVLCADAHKWLLGPEGSALFYCSRRKLSQIKVSNLGWASVENAYDFLSYDTTLMANSRRFENGTLNTVGIAGLKGAVDFLMRQGIDKISERILALTDVLYDGISAKGYVVISSRAPQDKSGIITFRHPSIPSDQLLEQLRQKCIICTERGDHIRFSPHFYNSEEELEQVISALPDA
jgi:selenocysteine lyase/cysteine desulfurase